MEVAPGHQASLVLPAPLLNTSPHRESRGWSGSPLPLTQRHPNTGGHGLRLWSLRQALRDTSPRLACLSVPGASEDAP